MTPPRGVGDAAPYNIQKSGGPNWAARCCLFADPVDLRQLFGGKTCVLHGLDVIENLLRLGRADQHCRDFLVAQQPCQRHLGQCLAAGGGHLVQRPDLRQLFRCEVRLLQETPIGVYAAVGRDAVQIPVGQ